MNFQQTPIPDEIPLEYLDGCTGFVDTIAQHDIAPCCNTHDIAYWYAETFIEKLTADVELGMCVIETGGDVISIAAAIVMFLATSTVGTYFWMTKDKRWPKRSPDK